MQTLSAWISNLGSQGLPAKTIKSYLTGVRSGQIDIGLADLDVFHHPSLQRIVNGIKRLQGERETRERLPVTRKVLIDLISQLDQSTKIGATLHAAFCLAFAAFLRCGEFTYTARECLTNDFDAWHLTRRSITFQDDHITLSLPSSKTDPFRRGVTLTIAEVDDSACAVASLRHLYKYFPESSSAPLFTTSTGSFTRDYVTSRLRSGLAQLGYTGNYSGHSFRRGAATSAREAGLTDAEIQLLGRWKSDAYLLYIQAHPAYILNTSRRFQQLSPT